MFEYKGPAKKLAAEIQPAEQQIILANKPGQEHLQ